MLGKKAEKPKAPTKDPMSFLPEDYVEKRIEQRTNLICLTLFGVVLAGVAGAYVVTARHRADVRKQREAVNQAYTEAAKRLAQLEQLQSQKDQMLRKAQTTATLLEPVPRTFLLADLVNRMPKSLSLFDFELKTKVEQPRRVISPRKSKLANKLGSKQNDEEEEPKAPPPPKVTVSMVMIGVAPTDVQVAQYMSALAQSKLLRDVNLVFSEEVTIEEAPMRRFRIEMMLNGSADVRQLDPLSSPRRLKTNPMDPKSVVTPLPATDPDLDSGSGSGFGRLFEGVSKLANGEEE